MASPKTFSSDHIDRQRASHLRADGYGRHRHLYLHDRIRRIAKDLKQTVDSPLKWLDYGCGKGTFIEEIRSLSLFSQIVGYDPAIPDFRAKPERPFDLVTCLDVIDIVEPRFLGAVLADVAAMTDGVALFDCLTMPKAATIKPHSAFYWHTVVAQHLEVLRVDVEFPRMQDFERVLITARPRA